MKRCVLLILILASTLSQGQTQSNAKALKYRFGGYYRSLVSTSHSYFNSDAYGDSLNRLRLNVDAVWHSSFLLHVEYDNELHFGNLISEPDFDLVRQRQDASYLDLLHVWVDTRHVYWDTSLYRGTATIRRGHAELIAGRQRIAWGTAHFWSPADVFNPISPAQVEEDERTGVDAAQLQLQLPRSIRWSVVFAPQDGIDRSTEATRIATTVHEFDIAALGGRFHQNWVAGADFAGQLSGAGLRGEFTYTARDQASQPNALRVAFGSDCAIGDKWYVQAEYFYNQGQPPGYVPGQSFDPSSLLRYQNEVYTLQRHFLSAGARYSITPLLNLQTYAVIDLAGPSVLFLPTATYSLSANTDLRATGQLFASSPHGEFDGVPNLFDLEYTVHF